jgi:hypothetical protein
LDACIAQRGVQYIGGRDPLGPTARRAAARGGASSGGGSQGEAAPPETLMGYLPCNPNGPAPGEAALGWRYRGGGNPNGPTAPL